MDRFARWAQLLISALLIIALTLICLNQGQTIEKQRVLIREMYNDCPYSPANPPVRP